MSEENKIVEETQAVAETPTQEENNRSRWFNCRKQEISNKSTISRSRVERTQREPQTSRTKTT